MPEYRELLTRGPMAGPANGASEKTLMPMPRVRAGKTSETSAPEFESGAAAKVPARKRKTRSEPMFFESAQPTFHMT